MISLRTLSIPMLALVAVLAGCTAETTPTSTSPTATQQQVASSDTTTATPEATPGNHHGGPGGPDMLVGAALRDSSLNLTDAQKTTIANLKDSLHGSRPAFDQTHATALAAAIRSGNVAAMTPPAPDQAKMQAHIADSAKAIQTLHDTLTSAQRTQLVTDVQNHALKGDHGDHKGPPALGFGGEGASAPQRMNDMHQPGGPFMKDLNLTDAQQTQLQALQPAKPSDAQIAQMKSSFEAMRTEMNAKLETFKGDNFDATAFVTPSKSFQPPGGDMHQNHLANLVSVLTPAQREILAQKIESGPQGH